MPDRGFEVLDADAFAAAFEKACEDARARALDRYREGMRVRGAWLRRYLEAGVEAPTLLGVLRSLARHRRLCRRVYENESWPTRIVLPPGVVQTKK